MDLGIFGPYAASILAIVAVVEGLQLLAPTYINGVVTIVTAVVVGLFMGLAKLVGIVDPVTGMALGLVAAGSVAFVKHLSTGTTPAGPSLK